MFANRGMHKHSPSKRPSHKVHCSGAMLFSKGHLDLYHGTPLKHIFLLVKQTESGKQTKQLCVQLLQALGIFSLDWFCALPGRNWATGDRGANMITLAVWPTNIDQTNHHRDDNHSANSLQQNNECVYSTMLCGATDAGHYVLLPIESLWPGVSMPSGEASLLRKKSSSKQFRTKFNDKARNNPYYCLSVFSGSESWWYDYIGFFFCLIFFKWFWSDYSIQWLSQLTEIWQLLHHFLKQKW